jgi:hypothetical protein
MRLPLPGKWTIKVVFIHVLYSHPEVLAAFILMQSRLGQKSGARHLNGQWAFSG